MRPFRALLRRASTQDTPNSAANTASGTAILALTRLVKPLIMSVAASAGNKFILCASFLSSLLTTNFQKCQPTLRIGTRGVLRAYLASSIGFLSF